MELERTATATIIPERSRYQLQHFVIGQHDTPQMRWRQILLEAQDLAYKIRMAELNLKKQHIEIQRLLASGDPIEAIEAEERQLGVALTERLLTAARMEFGWLEEIAVENGAYTTEEIEADQEQYWMLRLQRQAGLDQMAVREGISPANLQSMLNAGLMGRGPDRMIGELDGSEVFVDEVEHRCSSS